MSKKPNRPLLSQKAADTESRGLDEEKAAQLNEEGALYSFLVQEFGEEYARLFRSGRNEVEQYVRWWQQQFSTENDKIKDLGLEPEYFSSLEEAKKFLVELGEVLPSSLVIREFGIGDTQNLVTLFNETVRKVNRRDYSASQIEAWAPLEPDVDAWIARLSQTDTVVAELVGKTVAFGNLGKDGHLDYLYVHHEHQRQGLGTAVLESLESKARESGRTRIEANVSVTAREFFLRRGYTEIRKQEVTCRGERFVNFLMEKFFY